MNAREEFKQLIEKLAQSKLDDKELGMFETLVKSYPDLLLSTYSDRENIFINGEQFASFKADELTIAEFLLFSPEPNEQAKRKIEIVVDTLSVEQLFELFQKTYFTSKQTGLHILAVTAADNTLDAILSKVKINEVYYKKFQDLLFKTNEDGETLAQYALLKRNKKHRLSNDLRWERFLPTDNLQKFCLHLDQDSWNLMAYLSVIADLKLREEKVKFVLQQLGDKAAEAIVVENNNLNNALNSHRGSNLETIKSLVEALKRAKLPERVTNYIFGHPNTHNHSAYISCIDSVEIQNYFLDQLDFDNAEDVALFLNNFPDKNISSSCDFSKVPLKVLLKMPFADRVVQALHHKISIATATDFPDDLLTILARLSHANLALVREHFLSNKATPIDVVNILTLSNVTLLKKAISDIAQQHAIKAKWPLLPLRLISNMYLQLAKDHPQEYALLEIINMFEANEIEAGFKKLSKLSLPEALFLTGHCHQYGIGTVVKIDLAVEYYLKAIKANAAQKLNDELQKNYSNIFSELVTNRIFDLFHPNSTLTVEHKMKVAQSLYRHYFKEKQFDLCDNVVDAMKALNTDYKFSKEISECYVELKKKTKDERFHAKQLEMLYGPALLEEAEKMHKAGDVDAMLRAYISAINSPNATEAKRGFKGILAFLKKLTENTKPLPPILKTLDEFKQYVVPLPQAIYDWVRYMLICDPKQLMQYSDEYNEVLSILVEKCNYIAAQVATDKFNSASLADNFIQVFCERKEANILEVKRYQLLEFNAAITILNPANPKLLAGTKTLMALCESDPLSSDELVEALKLHASMVKDVLLKARIYAKTEKFQRELDELLQALPAVMESLKDQPVPQVVAGPVQTLYPVLPTAPEQTYVPTMVLPQQSPSAPQPTYVPTMVLPQQSPSAPQPTYVPTVYVQAADYRQPPIPVRVAQTNLGIFPAIPTQEPHSPSTPIVERKQEIAVKVEVKEKKVVAPAEKPISLADKAERLLKAKRRLEIFKHNCQDTNTAEKVAEADKPKPNPLTS